MFSEPPETVSRLTLDKHATTMFQKTYVLINKRINNVYVLQFCEH